MYKNSPILLGMSPFELSTAFRTASLIVAMTWRLQFYWSGLDQIFVGNDLFQHVLLGKIIHHVDVQLHFIEIIAVHT